MKVRVKLLLILCAAVAVTVATQFVIYQREQAAARASIESQLELATAAAAAGIDPVRLDLAAQGDRTVSADLGRRMRDIARSDPRIVEIIVYKVIPSTDDLLVAADSGLSRDRDGDGLIDVPTGQLLQPGSRVSLGPGEIEAIAASGTPRIDKDGTRLVALGPVWADGEVAGMVQVRIDARTGATGLTSVALVLGGGLLASLALVVLISRNYSRRLDLLAAGTRRLTEGDLAHRVDVAGADEVSDLARAFNAMADALEENRTNLGKAIAELGEAGALLEARADENEQLLRRTVEAVDEERRRLAAELHDGTIQSLQSVSMVADYASMLIERERYDEADERLDEARERLKDAIGELRRLLFDLRPPNLDEAGLTGALLARLEEAESLAGVSGKLEIPPDIRIPPELETVIYRFCQEALANVVRHSGATRAEVRIWRHGQSLVVEVSDNGAGFQPEAEPESGHFGLQGMRERAELAGGSLSVDSRHGSGTRLELRLPLTANSTRRAAQAHAFDSQSSSSA